MMSLLSYSRSNSRYLSAKGWPLAKPLQCVSLRIERRGYALLQIFTYTLTTIQLRENPMGANARGWHPFYFVFALATLETAAAL
jgi:hypothetical protein